MKVFLQIFLVLLLSSTVLKAQHAIDTVSNQEQLPGKFYKINHLYLASIQDPINPFCTHKYSSKQFFHGIGIATYQKLIDNNEVEIQYGVIDTFGNILIPFIYDEISYIQDFKGIQNMDPNLKYFKYKSENKLGLIGVDNQILFEFKSQGKYGKNRFDFELENRELNRDYVMIYIDNLYGLISLNESKITLPAYYDQIKLYPNYAICKKGIKTTVFDLNTKKISSSFTQLEILNKNGPFLISTPKHSYYICDDIFNPESSKNLSMNGDSILEHYKNKFLVLENSKMGVYNEDNSLALPFIYEDIYFLSENLYWVKQDSLWAIVDDQNTLLTKFEFYDIDKLNQHNFDNYMYYVDIDTTQMLLKLKNDIDAKIENLKYFTQEATFQLKSEVDRHFISEYCSYSVKMKDGYHLFRYKNDSIQIDKYAWDNIYSVTRKNGNGCKIGVEKDGKFGYYSISDFKLKDIKYHGLYFNPALNSSRIYDYHESPFAIIKHDSIYFRYTYYYIPWWQRIPISFLSSSETRSRTIWKKYKR